jgi:hypothetical protein
MISSLFRRAFAKEAADENNKNDANEALKSRMHTEVATRVDEDSESSAGSLFVKKDMDHLSAAVCELLVDKNLEVSKVRPFFWSMVEVYVDRFHKYPFDIVKALFLYIEAEDYSADETRALVNKLEEHYERQYGEPMHKSTKLVCSDDGLDDEIKELRESIKYASMVGELEEA